jgi:dihydrofolate synthase/folylpolyglutamate synthase
MGFHAYTYAVFGSMLDKDIDGVIAQIKGKIDHWCVTDLPLPRAATASQIHDKLLAAGVFPDAEHSIQDFESPEAAYTYALKAAGENDRIAVFGSFLTVAGVMKARKAMSVDSGRQ